jgi:hypothetical protein
VSRADGIGAALWVLVLTCVLTAIRFPVRLKALQRENDHGVLDLRRPKLTCDGNFGASGLAGG